MGNLVQRLRALLPSPGRPVKPRVDAFTGMVDAFADRCAQWPADTGAPAAEPQRFGVLVTPWLSTAVPFFSLECATQIRRAGHTPVILFDDTDLVQNSPEQAHAGQLRTLLASHFADVEVHLIGEAGTRPLVGDSELADPIFRENAIWRARGEVKADGFMVENQAASARIASHVGKVRGLLAAGKLDRLLIPGGMFGLSAIYVAMARELGISFATFDGSAGLLRLAQNGVAAHLADLPQAFQKLAGTLDAATREKVETIAQAELDDRLHSRDHRQFQLQAATGRTDLRYDLVIPLNIRWDSAALGRQRAFPTVAAWLEAVLTWVAGHPELKVCIRQHPRERLDFAKGSDNLAPLLARFATLGERLRYVAADEAVNTYDLLRHTRVVLPHTSTVGIEAALLGKPVVLSAACYYESLGFCHQAATPGEYFALITQALDGQLAVTPTQQADAALAYYLTQRCALARTVFTAHPDDFRTWVQTPPDALWNQPEVADFRSSLLTGQPFAQVRHQRLCHAH